MHVHGRSHYLISHTIPLFSYKNQGETQEQTKQDSHNLTSKMRMLTTHLCKPIKYADEEIQLRETGYILYV